MKYCWMLYIEATLLPSPEIIKEWLAIGLAFNKKLGLLPNGMGISGKGYPKSVVTFKKGHTKAVSKAFEGITGMEIYAVPEEADNFSFDWKVLMDINFSKITGNRIFIGTDTIAPGVREEIMNEVLLPCCNLLNVMYGYSFFMHRDKGPHAYGLGFTHLPAGNHLSESEDKLIVKWNAYKKEVKEGMLRDVYQENILSAKQLGMLVQGKRLEDWIKTDPAHGELSIIAGIPFWKIGTNHLLTVRDILHQHQVIIAYDQNIVPGIITGS